MPAANLLSRSKTTVYVLKLVHARLKILFLVHGRINEGKKKVLSSGQDSTAELGIEVIDVRVKHKLIYSDEVSSSIY